MVLPASSYSTLTVDVAAAKPCFVVSTKPVLVKVSIVRTYGAVLTVLSDTTIVITVTGSMTNFS